jgi:hypothetical protein
MAAPTVDAFAGEASMATGAKEPAFELLVAGPSAVLASFTAVFFAPFAFRAPLATGDFSAFCEGLPGGRRIARVWLTRECMLGEAGPLGRWVLCIAGPAETFW